MQFVGKTNIGKIRGNNEDCFFAEKDFFIVADGMGGHIAGEVASNIAVETIKKSAAHFKHEKKIAIILKEAFIKANEIIIKQSKLQSCVGMGTTATALAINKEKAYWAHIGDSRLYLYRSGKLKQITVDHSYIRMMVEKGLLTKKEAEIHPKRNILLYSLGMRNTIRIDKGVLNIQKEDFLLLCTDGLTNMVNHEKIVKILENEFSIEKK